MSRGQRFSLVFGNLKNREAELIKKAVASQNLDDLKTTGLTSNDVFAVIIIQRHYRKCRDRRKNRKQEIDNSNIDAIHNENNNILNDKTITTAKIKGISNTIYNEGTTNGEIVDDRNSEINEKIVASNKSCNNNSDTTTTTTTTTTNNNSNNNNNNSNNNDDDDDVKDLENMKREYTLSEEKERTHKLEDDPILFNAEKEIKEYVKEEDKKMNKIENEVDEFVNSVKVHDFERGTKIREYTNKELELMEQGKKISFNEFNNELEDLLVHDRNKKVHSTNNNVRKTISKKEVDKELLELIHNERDIDIEKQELPDESDLPDHGIVLK